MLPSHLKSNERIFKMSFIDFVIGHLELRRVQSSDICFSRSNLETIGFGWSCWLDCLPKRLHVGNKITSTDGGNKTPHFPWTIMNYKGGEPAQSEFKGIFSRSAARSTVSVQWAAICPGRVLRTDLRNGQLEKSIATAPGIWGIPM